MPKKLKTRKVKDGKIEESQSVFDRGQNFVLKQVKGRASDLITVTEYTAFEAQDERGRIQRSLTAAEARRIAVEAEIVEITDDLADMDKAIGKL